MQVIEAMEATEYIVFDYTECEQPGLLRALSRSARARVASLLWSASGYREGLSPVVAVRLRAALIRLCTPLIWVRAAFTQLQSIFVVERPAARVLMVRRPVAVAACVLAALVLVFVPTSAVQQLAYYTVDANAGLISGAGPVEADGAIPVDFVAFSHLSDKPSEEGPLTEEEPLAELTAASTPLSPFVPGQESTSVPVRAEPGLVERGLVELDLAEPGSAASVLAEPGLAEPAITDSDILDKTSRTDSGILDRTSRTDSGAAGTVVADNLSHAESSPESASAYIWPADGTLTSRYGYRSTSVGSSNHKGIDISGMYGDPIYAAADGEVIVSGWSNSFGYVIHIQHDNGDVTLYSHCSALLVSVGERVDQGQDIAKMGKTGIASGVHLHFELLINGQNVNPQSYLP